MKVSNLSEFKTAIQLLRCDGDMQTRLSDDDNFFPRRFETTSCDSHGKTNIFKFHE